MSGEYASSLLSTSAFVLGVIRAADALLGEVNPADLDAVFGAEEEEEERMERRSVRYLAPFLFHSIYLCVLIVSPTIIPGLYFNGQNRSFSQLVNTRNNFVFFFSANVGVGGSFNDGFGVGGGVSVGNPLNDGFLMTVVVGLGLLSLANIAATFIVPLFTAPAADDDEEERSGRYRNKAFAVAVAVAAAVAVVFVAVVGAVVSVVGDDVAAAVAVVFAVAIVAVAVVVF